jgi:hypothetical protein
MRTSALKTDSNRERSIQFMLLTYIDNALLDAVRSGRRMVLDGPFAEAKEVLGGFTLIEARDIDEAIEIAASFPWTKAGCIEVRAVQDLNEVRTRVGAPAAR